ncbi:MAG: DNA repair protein RecN [Bacillota bacterium]
MAELQVQNFALISQLRINFSQGLNILTGETGAGKSIIIDALGLALGERFSPEMIRTGCEELSIEAVFSPPIPRIAYEYLNNQGISAKYDENIIIIREINASGRNRCRINGTSVTVSALAELSRCMVDIHGQHEHQSLLQSEKHLELLDRFGGDSILALKSEVAVLFREREAIKRKLAETLMNEQEKARRIEIYTFELQEIDAVNPKPGEDEQLQADFLRLSSAEKLSQLSKSLCYILNEENEGGIAGRLGYALKDMEQLASLDKQSDGWIQNLLSLKSQTEDLARELRNYEERIEHNPEALNVCQQRISDIQNLKRKYGPEINDILNHKLKIAGDLETIQHMESDREEHQKKLREIEARLLDKGKNLSEQRKKAAETLAERIEEQLNELNMKNTRFIIKIEQKEDPQGLPDQGRTIAVSENGLDHVEFLVAPNLGEEPRPLHKIASGGELSRIMLGIKAILGELDDLPTMIFDEIDAGVGGRTSQVVAEKLIFIGQQRQVICITHLPQIASMGHAHFYLEKTARDGRTFVSIKTLNMTERVQELARMLGGAAVTGTTLEHAQEMLTLAEQVKLKKVGLHAQ